MIVRILLVIHGKTEHGCPDDGDGWSNGEDRFVNDSSQWHDVDGDGFGDNIEEPI